MKRILFTVWLFCLSSVFMYGKDTVVLLHGLARSSASMDKLACALQREGYRVCNMDYPSRKFPVELLAAQLAERIAAQTADADRVHVVTHSMGGILLRYMQKHFPVRKLGRVVMLSPPNHGSEVVDKLGGLAVFRWVNGPAGSQLGTDEEGLIAGLGPVDFELGVITGDRSINWILSTMIPGPDDGKVSVASAQVEGMKAFKVESVSHPFIMKNQGVIGDVISFLQSGAF